MIKKSSCQNAVNNLLQLSHQQFTSVQLSIKITFFFIYSITMTHIMGINVCTFKIFPWHQQKKYLLAQHMLFAQAQTSHHTKSLTLFLHETMIWCFTSLSTLSTLSKSYRDDGRVTMKGSVQWSTVQPWAVFCLQQYLPWTSCSEVGSANHSAPRMLLFRDKTEDSIKIKYWDRQAWVNRQTSPLGRHKNTL